MSAGGWQIAFISDGQGYHYTATHTGVLWASGWVRSTAQGRAYAYARDLAQKAKDGDEMNGDLDPDPGFGRSGFPGDDGGEL